MMHQTAAFWAYENDRIKGLPYLLFTPKKVEEGKKYPLIIFLHGAGERGNNPEAVLCHPLPALLAEGRELPAFVVCPQCPNDLIWNDVSFELKAFIDQLIADLPIDTKKITLTGLSMGGYGTWHIGNLFPHFFAGLAPICGGGVSWNLFNLKDTPVWAFHGDADDIVPVRNTLEMCDRLESIGGKVELTLLHHVGHDSWNFAYRRTRLIDWLLEQELK